MIVAVSATTVKITGFPPDKTTSHSAKLANYASKTAGYARE